jgi:hypothetical protein
VEIKTVDFEIDMLKAFKMYYDTDLGQDDSVPPTPHTGSSGTFLDLANLEAKINIHHRAFSMFASSSSWSSLELFTVLDVLWLIIQSYQQTRPQL